MAWVYRYTDLADGIIKYVGVVWGKTRTLEQRLKEHERDDTWCNTRRWKIEYIEEDIETRAEAEAFETHFIELYGTDKYFNVSKGGWGLNKFLPDYTDKWKEYNCKSIYDIEYEKINKKKQNIIDKIETAKQEVNELEYNLSCEKEKIKIALREIDNAKQNEEYVKNILIGNKNITARTGIYPFLYEDVFKFFYYTRRDDVDFINVMYDSNGIEIVRQTLTYSKDTNKVYYREESKGKTKAFKDFSLCGNHNPMYWQAQMENCWGEISADMFGYARYYPSKDLYDEYINFLYNKYLVSKDIVYKYYEYSEILECLSNGKFDLVICNHFGKKIRFWNDERKIELVTDNERRNITLYYGSNEWVFKYQDNNITIQHLSEEKKPYMYYNIIGEEEKPCIIKNPTNEMIEHFKNRFKGISFCISNEHVCYYDYIISFLTRLNVLK